MCEPLGPMKVTCAPWSKAATSNAQRVRVESFSKISTISLPRSRSSSRPAFLAALRSVARSSMYRISSPVKSARRSRWRPLRSMGWFTAASSGVTNDRTGHAMAPAAAPAELLSGDGQHLDTCLAKFGIGGLVAFVRDDYARFEGDDVVAVVPLVPLRLELVAAGRDNRHLVEAERILHLVEEGSLRQRRLHACGPTRTEQDREDLRDHRLEECRHVAVAEGEHGVQVHRRPVAWHLRPYDQTGRARFEQVLGQDADRSG